MHGREIVDRCASACSRDPPLSVAPRGPSVALVGCPRSPTLVPARSTRWCFWLVAGCGLFSLWAAVELQGSGSQPPHRHSLVPAVQCDHALPALPPPPYAESSGFSRVGPRSRWRCAHWQWPGERLCRCCCTPHPGRSTDGGRLLDTRTHPCRCGRRVVVASGRAGCVPAASPRAVDVGRSRRHAQGDRHEVHGGAHQQDRAGRDQNAVSRTGQTGGASGGEEGRP